MVIHTSMLSSLWLVGTEVQSWHSEQRFFRDTSQGVRILRLMISRPDVHLHRGYFDDCDITEHLGIRWPLLLGLDRQP